MWKSQATFNRFSPSGVWRLNFTILDAVGHATIYENVQRLLGLKLIDFLLRPLLSPLLVLVYQMRLHPELPSSRAHILTALFHSEHDVDVAD